MLQLGSNNRHPNLIEVPVPTWLPYPDSIDESWSGSSENVERGRREGARGLLGGAGAIKWD